MPTFLLHEVPTLLVYGIELFLRLANLLVDELLCRGRGVDRVLGLFVDVLAGQFGSDRLSGLGIATAIGDVEAVSNVVTTGVDLHLDVPAHVVDDDFHRLAAHPFGLVDLVLLHQRLEGAATRDDLRDAV